MLRVSGRAAPPAGRVKPRVRAGDPASPRGVIGRELPDGLHDDQAADGGAGDTRVRSIDSRSFFRTEGGCTFTAALPRLGAGRVRAVGVTVPAGRGRAPVPLPRGGGARRACRTGGAWGCWPCSTTG